MIRKSLPFLLMAFALIIVVQSCKKADDKPTPYPENEAYFPLEVGKWVVYEVDSTIWDDTFCIERFYHYQIQHRVADTFTDEMGRLSYRVDRLIRRFPEEPWQEMDVFYATNTGTNIEVIYDQLRFVKMAFPIAERLNWEGNTYIESNDPEFSFYKDWIYEYRDYEDAFNTGFKVFDNTVKVLQIDQATSDPELYEEEFASRTKSMEVYAKGVGMVYREFIRWTYDPMTTKCRKGTGVVMRAVDHN